ncbi:helix-turn-helix domain-containing protein [Azospirillum rugosum]|uniref:helix-turn-helix domain-containing protein n=1 Tax=Azospirillum rugosum TaxID=416170 RepID=UPI001AE99EC1|nr:helix-turn-helix transcriptional regulator [Azospirillum rugosum]MDQ0526539.1 transcriptional regulator with XRE-family HTH domain [Azospirillum rugosum]
MDIRRQVGLNVQRIRRSRGWSQEELAFESGLHRTYISGIERGARNPTVTVLKELADALGVSAASLLELEQPIQSRS